MPGRKSAAPRRPSASSYEEMALDRLKSHGLRITMPRVQVIRVLGRLDCPLSPYGIHEEIVSSGGRIDVVSVYRILATLVEVGLAHHVGLADGYIACRFADRHPTGTEHVVCERCSKVVELPLPPEVTEATARQLSELGFEGVTTRVEVLGVCSACNGEG